MAKETQKEKIARLEKELAAMTEQRDSYRDDANSFKKQVNARVEETDAYKAIIRQLGSEQTKVKVAQDAQKRTDESNKKLRQFNAQLMQKLETLGVSQDEIESLLDNVESVSQTAQNTAESVSDVQATDDLEEAQNGTQGGTEAVAEPLPESIPLGKWQREIAEKLRDIYDDRNQYLKKEAAVKIVRIWCATQKAEEALGMLYDYILAHLPQESDKQDEPDTISGFAREKIEALQEKISELEAKIDSTKTTEQYNSVTEKYRLVDEQVKKIKGLEKERDNAVIAQNALKSDLEAAQAEVQTLKQESSKNQKNPFGAGRKPKLTDNQVQEIQQLRAEGLSVRKIAAKMDCSAALVCKLLKN